MSTASNSGSLDSTLNTLGRYPVSILLIGLFLVLGLYSNFQITVSTLTISLGEVLSPFARAIVIFIGSSLIGLSFYLIAYINFNIRQRGARILVDIIGFAIPIVSLTFFVYEEYSSKNKGDLVSQWDQKSGEVTIWLNNSILNRYEGKELLFVAHSGHSREAYHSDTLFHVERFGKIKGYEKEVKTSFSAKSVTRKLSFGKDILRIKCYIAPHNVNLLDLQNVGEIEDRGCILIGKQGGTYYPNFANGVDIAKIFNSLSTSEKEIFRSIAAE